MNAVSRASSIVGSRAELARRIGVSAEAVRKWELGKLPAERCLAIEAATGGAVTRAELRPDLFGNEPKSEDVAA